MIPLRHLFLLSAAFALLPSVLRCAGEFADTSDSIPGIHRTTPLQFPLRLQRRGVKQGDVRVLLQIDSSGTLTDSLVVASTDPAFTEEVLQVVKQWRFEPLRRGGETLGSVVELLVNFKIDGLIAVERLDGTRGGSASALGEHAYQARGASALDRLPTPSHVVPPVYPPEWRAKNLTGRVTVDFYIDETGGVRMPTVAPDTDPLLGASAIAAVREWRFSPPLHQGQPALARVQQVFNFSPDSTP